MNKKLLFAAISLAALTACTSDDFESKKIAAEGTSPVKFEVINNNDGFTRASMSGNKVVWSATDGDLFTLYHGAALGATGGHENATYTAETDDDGNAVLTTPSMIKAGGAVMVWPVDTTFYYDIAGALTIKIPALQGGEDEDGNDIIQYQIPYVSDEINIGGYGAYNEDPLAGPVTAWNTAGKDRKYPVFMRPMASQLNLIADYAGTDATLATLYAGDDPIDPIKLTSVDLLTTPAGGGGTTDFTQEIGVKFTAPTPAINTQWAGVAHSAWNNVTDFDLTNIVTAVDQLTTESLNGNESCKFLILPQNPIAVTLATDGVDDGGVVINTIYGKVVIADAGAPHGSLYTAAELADAWYRYVSPATVVDPQENKALVAEASGEYAGKHKTTSAPALGMAQTINAFSANTAASGVVKGEPQGAAATRFVKVLLTHLDMSDLHIESDKQLYDAVRVWDKMGLSSVEVYLDGKGTSNAFVISQKTIKKINEINAAAAGARFFSVKPCATHTCNEIVVTGGDKIEDMTFIVDDAGHKADVVLQTGETWKWDGTVKVATAATTGINEIINRGTLENAEAKILNIKDPTGTAVDITVVNDVPGKWNITAAGRVRVQNSVRNNGTVTISKGAQLIEDDAAAITATFTNNALGLPTRFGGDNRFGKVNNYGVFAIINGGIINNYGLIEHADKDAKTYVTSNETAGASFATAFGAGNIKGRINLPYSNKDEDNISITATATPPFEGFISVTVDGDAPTSTLNAATVGTFVNYMIVKSGIDDIAFLPTQVEYVEVDTDHEVYWSIPAATLTGGLIVLSDVNVKLGTTLNATTATYLGAEMYVGGTFNTGSWNGYYGATGTRVAEHYITY